MRSKQSNLKLSCLTTDDEFLAIRDEWSNLLDRNSRNVIFLTWEWLYTWWNHYKGPQRLFIIIVRDPGGTLVGLAPFYIRSHRIKNLFPMKVLSFLGSEEVCSEYLDIIVSGDEKRKIIKQIVDYLDSCSDQWDYVYLSDFSESSENLTYFKEIFNVEKINYYVLEKEICPYIELPDDFNLYCSGLSKNMRYNLRRRIKNLHKNFDTEFTHVQDAKDVSKNMDILFNLHGMRREMLKNAGDFLKARLIEFHRDVAQVMFQKGYLRIYKICIDGQIESILYGYSYNKTFSFYQSGMNPEYEKHSIGLVLMGMCIKDCIENREQEFDFLRGVEPYKYKWTQKTRNTSDLVFSFGKAKGEVYLAAKKTEIYLKEMAKIKSALPGIGRAAQRKKHAGE